MAYHITHSEHYILYEPEAEYLQTEDIDDLINEVLTNFPEVTHVIIFMGHLEYLLDEDLDQLKFLNEELKAKGGYLLLASGSDNLKEQFDNKVRFAPDIEDAVEVIESEWLDRELFTEGP